MIRLLSGLFLTLFSLSVSARYSVEFTCPKYSGVVSLGDGVIQTELFDPHPSMGDFSGDRILSLDRFDYVECKDPNFFCLMSPNELELKKFGGLPVTIPKVIYPGKTYHTLGVTIETRRVFYRRYKSVVRVLVRRDDKEGSEWYNLTVVNGLGIVDFHLSTLHGINSQTGGSVDFKDLTCVLQSPRGMFADVVVR